MLQLQAKARAFSTIESQRERRYRDQMEAYNKLPLEQRLATKAPKRATLTGLGDKMVVRMQDDQHQQQRQPLLTGRDRRRQAAHTKRSRRTLQGSDSSSFSPPSSRSAFSPVLPPAQITAPQGSLLDGEGAMDGFSQAGHPNDNGDDTLMPASVQMERPKKRIAASREDALSVLDASLSSGGWVDATGQ